MLYVHLLNEWMTQWLTDWKPRWWGGLNWEAERTEEQPWWGELVIGLAENIWLVGSKCGIRWCAILAGSRKQNLRKGLMYRCFIWEVLLRSQDEWRESRSACCYSWSVCVLPNSNSYLSGAVCPQKRRHQTALSLWAPRGGSHLQPCESSHWAPALLPDLGLPVSSTVRK